MPESDAKRELGGLARSIDALFSQPLPSVEPLPVADEMEPDPFDSLESYEELPAEQDPTPALTFAEGEASEEVAWDGPDLALEESVPSVDLATAAQPAAAQSPVDVGHEADGAGLQGAIESFLSGAPGAADDARAMSAKLQERLALDPLADAVERLVNLGGAAPDPDAVALAQEVINPAVASRLVQRMGHEEDHEKRAAYVILSERLGMVMAKAFRGALTDSNDARARRTYYDGLLAMGETSRPVIEAMVEDDNRFLVRNALALLGEMGGDRAVELVTSALANTDARVRCEALASLAKLGGEDTRQLVMASLEDSDSKVRAAAAVTAGELGIERALKPILELLDGESDPAALVSLLQGLGKLGDPGAVQAIEKRAVTTLFSKPPTEVRVAAYLALHEIGTPHARDLVTQARDDKDAVVRTTARGLSPAG